MLFNTLLFLSVGWHKQCVFWYGMPIYWKRLKNRIGDLPSNKNPFYTMTFFTPEIVWGNRELHSYQLEVWRQPWVHPKGLFSPCCSSNGDTSYVEGLLFDYSHYHYNYCNAYNYNYSNFWWFAFYINPAGLCQFSEPFLFCIFYFVSLNNPPPLGKG